MDSESYYGLSLHSAAAVSKFTFFKIAQIWTKDVVSFVSDFTKLLMLFQSFRSRDSRFKIQDIKGKLFVSYIMVGLFIKMTDALCCYNFFSRLILFPPPLVSFSSFFGECKKKMMVFTFFFFVLPLHFFVFIKKVSLFCELLLRSSFFDDIVLFWNNFLSFFYNNFDEYLFFEKITILMG